VLGPAEMTASVIRTAAATANRYAQQWSIELAFTAVGSLLFDHFAAAHCRGYKQDPRTLLLFGGSARPRRHGAVCSQHASCLLSGLSTGEPLHRPPPQAPAGRRQAVDIAALSRYGPLPVPLLAQGTETVTPAPAPTDRHIFLAIQLYKWLNYRCPALPGR
jgi:preprotein translocase subunit SecD